MNNKLLIDTIEVDAKKANKDYVFTTIPKAALLTTIDATHSGYVNSNFYYYDPDSMKESYHTWTTPYKKPILRHHNLGGGLFSSAEDPMGRVQDARFLKDARGGFIQLDARITDEDAKAKIMDSRYETVSTAGKPVDFVECSVCGVNMLKGGKFCGHNRGQVYEDEESAEKKLAYWKIGPMQYKEMSFVNAPADQSDTHAARVVSWQFADSEQPAPAQQDQVRHTGIWVFDTQVVLPDSGIITLFREKPDEDMIVNKSLWEAIEGDISRYAELGGLVLRPDSVVTPISTTVPEGANLAQEEHFAQEGQDDDDDEEWTEDDLKVLDWLMDELEKLEDEALSKSRKLTNKVGQKGKVAHNHVVRLNEVGNGRTDWVLSHSHDVVNSKISDAVSRGEEKAHNHSITEDLKVPKKKCPWELYERYTTDFPNIKGARKHRHVVDLNEAENGDTEYVVAHNHEVVGNRILPSTADGDTKAHTHKLGDLLTEDQWLDEETWDIVTEAKDKLSEKTKKSASKAGKKFCGPQDPRKGRKSFPAYRCQNVRSGLQLLAKYKGPGSKAKIRKCLLSQNKKLKCGITTKDLEVYDLLALVETLISG